MASKSKIISKMAVNGVSSRVIRLIFLAAVFAAAQGVIRVASFDDLRAVGRDGDHPLSADYELICDIDASASRVSPFEPIGGGRLPFTGRFFGRGEDVYVISNLSISKPSSGHVGLFGIVGYGAEVSNVGVLADTVRGSFAVGVLAGSNNGRIVNCYGTGVVVAYRRESDAGGLVGINSGGIYRSYSSASVYGADNVGGLVGLLRVSAASGEVLQSFAVGGVRGNDNVGGLVGQIFGGRVRECFSAGRVSGSGGAVGGLIGLDFAATPVWNDRGISVVDGVASYVGAGEISGSFWDMDASGRRASAGGEGKSAAQMKRRETFAGWDFNGVWAIERDVGYPQLARIPYNTRSLSYAVEGGGGCGRLRVVGVSGGVAELYRYGADVMLGADGPAVTAEPWNGCYFAGWSDGKRDARRVDAALRNAEFTAKFDLYGSWTAARVYRYRAGSGGWLRASGVSGLVTGVDTAVAGVGGFAVAAAPRAGYRFAGWSDGAADVVRKDIAPEAVAPTALFRENGGKIITVSGYDDLYLIGKSGGYYPLDGNYELVRDIAIPANGRIEPIGSESAPFTGVFKGNGRSINGLDMGRDGKGGDFMGLFGYVEGADIRGVFVTGSVAGVDNVGMLVGKSVNSVIDSCGASGAARGRSGVGGLVGRSVGSLISRAYSTASVSGSGDEVGGLVGGARNSFLAQCYASGAVSGAMYVGGAVGWGIGGFAQDCYAVGYVVGESEVGGFIGKAGGGVGVSRGYSAGYVVGGRVGTGGFAGALGGADNGSVGGAVFMEGCYWDVGRSGKSVSVGGVGAGTAEMRRKETYAGWDFKNVWNIGAGYPWLRGLEPDSTPEVFFERRRAPVTVSVSAKPLLRVIGRAIYVNAPPGETVRIKLIDMRGKTIAGYEVAGAKKLLMDKAASGAYIVEAKRRGRRETVSSVGIFK